MADVVVGDAPDLAEAHGQQRLGALERLHLAVLVDTGLWCRVVVMLVGHLPFMARLASRLIAGREARV